MKADDSMRLRGGGEGEVSRTLFIPHGRAPTRPLRM